MARNQQPPMKKILLLLLFLAVALAVTLRVRYGGGGSYPDLSTPPVLDAGALEEVLSYAEPVGNVAVSAGGRIFFSVHPEARPQGNRLLEYVAGAAEPYPDGTAQQRLFDTVLGIFVDSQNRLWTIDHGNHGLRTPRLLAFDLETDELIHDQPFDGAIAPPGSFLQDLRVSRDGRTVIIADTSFWRKRPAIIVYDIESSSARRVLEGHPSVSAEDYIISNHGTRMTFGYGLVALRGGVDGIALDDEWLYFGAISGAGLYRVALGDLRDAGQPPAQLAARVERHATKPLSDGMIIDPAGIVLGTDVEHGAVFVVYPGQSARTLIRSDRLRWPDALAFGPDGWLYVSDSNLADVVLKPREHIESHRPYRIFRFRPFADDSAGQ
jgi:sugar lactone lactonase YvrE